MKLTDKQMQFVREYPIDFNATQAAIRAGYAKKTANREGTRLLSKVVIQQELKKYMEERAKKTDLSVEKVLTNVEEVRNRCMQGEEVKIVIEGIEVGTGEWKFDSKGALKALELQGKYLAMWTDKRIVTEKPIPLSEFDEGPQG